MAHVSHKLTNSFEGALAGGGDPATSPLYVFGPFLKLIVVAGVAHVTFGVSVWMVVVTVAVVSGMYRLVMGWVVDGSGGSGLSEEEFGSWAVKINAGITFVEYTLTFLVSVAALVTFLADRFPALNGSWSGLPFRTVIAVGFSFVIGWLVNRGPKMAARAFGPATLAVLVLLWGMVVATIWKFGVRLPGFDLRAFHPEFLHFTLSGYARILALMTGIEIFANLVAAYGGTAREKSRKAFGSLMIIMGTTSVTMLIVGPAILQVSDPTNPHVSVFTQTMDRLLPAPLPYIGTLIGIIVLGSAAAASAQGLQNLALGLRYRHYIPAALGQRNRFDVADKPVWVEVGLVSLCFLVFGTQEETYLSIYAAGVFILLSMTGWAAAKRLRREARTAFSLSGLAALAGTGLAAVLASGATAIIFAERFTEGAWAYFIFIPALYGVFSYFRNQLGEPKPLEEHLGRFLVGQYLLPFEREGRPADETTFDRVLVPLDGTTFAEAALPLAETLCHCCDGQLTLMSISGQPDSTNELTDSMAIYLERMVWRLRHSNLEVDGVMRNGPVAREVLSLAREIEADLLVMSTHGLFATEGMLADSVSNQISRQTNTPLLLIRPTADWRSRTSQFKRLLVNLDGSEAAETVLRFVRAIARRFDSEILLLSVPEADAEQGPMQGYLEQVTQALQEQGFQVTCRVTGSGPARTIKDVSESEDRDLILLTTHGRGGVNRPVALGSVADRLIQITTRPIFLVPVMRPRPADEEPGDPG
ncbi:MAG: universal stress protein [Blastocatellia bacterium]|nr:universal stress protein [Blastocatellia bacterium]